MIVEINGVGFLNMGAELMLVAARDEMLSWEAVDKVAISFRLGSRAQRKHVGSSSVLRLNSDRRKWANRVVQLCSRAIPAAALRPVDYCKPSAVSALVDASGFAFGDQWGPAPSQRNARVFGQYAREDKPVVLLPQAFGPFEQPSVAEAAKEALGYAALVFARDEESLAHVRGLGVTESRLRLAPDFTNLVEPSIKVPHRETVIVVPNARMTDMDGSIDEMSYFEFLQGCVAASIDAGYEVVVMGHEDADRRVAMRLVGSFVTSATSYDMADPVETKAVVGGSSLVISSRYHGIVSALSQSVPTIGTSWSHKYRHLFADYGCEEALWPVVTRESAYRRVLDWLAPGELAARRAALMGPADSLKVAAGAMWSEVRSVLGA